MDVIRCTCVLLASIGLSGIHPEASRDMLRPRLKPGRLPWLRVGPVQKPRVAPFPSTLGTAIVRSPVLPPRPFLAGRGSIRPPRRSSKFLSSANSWTQDSRTLHSRPFLPSPVRVVVDFGIDPRPSETSYVTLRPAMSAMDALRDAGTRLAGSPITGANNPFVYQIGFSRRLDCYTLASIGNLAASNIFVWQIQVSDATSRTIYRGQCIPGRLIAPVRGGYTVSLHYSALKRQSPQSVAPAIHELRSL